MSGHEFFEESFARRFGVIVIGIYESVQRRSNPIVKFPQSSDAVHIPWIKQKRQVTKFSFCRIFQQINKVALVVFRKPPVHPVSSYRQIKRNQHDTRRIDFCLILFFAKPLQKGIPSKGVPENHDGIFWKPFFYQIH